MVRLIKFGLVLVQAILLAACAIQGTTKSPDLPLCHELRAAWDFGSGAIKVKAAEVNVCELKIVKLLFDESVKVGFKEDLDRDGGKLFLPATMASAKNWIRTTKEKLQRLGVEKMRGVATAAFRESRNGQVFLNQINSEFALRVELLPQIQEGRLGFQSAQAKLATPLAQTKDIWVWDIGGGSQQLSWMDGSGIRVAESEWASVSFKNWVLRNIKKGTGNPATESPNPWSKEEVLAAVKKAEMLGQEIRTQLGRPLGARVYGIGGVHSSSLLNQVKKSEITPQDIEAILPTAIRRTDADIKSPFAATETSNLILVLGLMRGLGITKYTPLKVNLADGLLVFGEY